MLKRFFAATVALLIALQPMTTIEAATDRDILSDPVNKVYTASSTGEAIQNNLNFIDVPSTYWAKEPITRLGALSVVKGYNEGGRQAYRPGDGVTNEEGLAFLLRLVGQEAAATQAAEAIDANPDDATLTIWSRGYLQVAANLGLITGAQLADGLVLDQAQLNPEFNWQRTAPLTREQMAQWIVQAVNTVNAGTIEPIYTYQQLFNLKDWEAIDQAYLPFVEAVIEKNIMVGDGANFKPKDGLTRAEMAKIMVNLEDILYSTMGLTLKAGVVGSIKSSADIGSLETRQLRTYLIRNNQGQVDQVDHIYNEDSQKRLTNKDIPVLTENGVAGLESLKEGDYIQYVVNEATNAMHYIYKTATGSPIKVTGSLKPLSDLDNNKITLENSTGMTFTYSITDGLYDAAGKTLRIGDDQYPVAMAPVANTVTLTLQNNVVTKIDYNGATPLTREISGIVKEVNSGFNFITIEQWNGGEATKYFRPGNVTVEKSNFYDTEDEVGYIDEVYPYHGYDERDSDINAIEPGDIVHMTLDPSNLAYVTAISAKTNYSVRFGEITNISDNGADGATIRVTYDNNAVAALKIAADVPVLTEGKNIGVRGLKTGQMVKLLMNQAVLAPGKNLETVKQIDVDPYGNVAAKMYKGELGIYNKPEASLSLLNSYTLSPAGWHDYTRSTNLDLSGDGVEVYYQGNRVSLDYADNYLRKSGMQVYAVTEKHFGEERLARLLLEEGRGQVLASTNLAYANGSDRMRLLSKAAAIGLDKGTIVVKNGHIVSVGSLLAPDYAQVVLGDANKAVMVHVTQEPNNDALTILRGRINSIDDGEKFNVASNAMLKEMEWIYSPVEREFTLSYDTVIIDNGGRQPLSEFIDYTDLSKVDEVYTIVADGTKATHLYKNTYATNGVIGTIYKTDDDKLYIRDAYVYDSNTKKWAALSLRNNYAEIAKQTETLYIKNNKVVDASELAYGDKIRVLVTENLTDEVKLRNNRTVKGYIVFVE